MQFINLGPVVFWVLWIIGFLFVLLIAVAAFLSWRQRRFDAYMPNMNRSSGWASYFNPDNYPTTESIRESVYSDDVDFQSDIYADSELELAEKFEQFKAHTKETITKYYCDLTAKEREERWRADVAREKQLIREAHNKRKIEHLFQENDWLLWIGKDLRIDDGDYNGYIDLFGTISKVFLEADRQFGGAMPSKKTWQLAKSLKVPFYARNRHFWECVTDTMGRKGLLTNAYGRGGRRITNTGRNKIKSLIMAVEMSRTPEKIP